MLRIPKTFTYLFVGLLLQASLLTGASAQSRFSVVLNEQSNFGDSRKSVVFFDADNLNDGPLFSVFTGYEGSNNFDEPNAIDVDPDTGDVYILAYDSGTAGNIDAGTIGSDGEDTEGDYDLLKINFATVLNDWKTNYQGTDVRSPLVVGGPAPAGGGYANSTNSDYVTYGVTSPNFMPFDFDATHSNTVVLPGSIEKIGEVKRNSGDSTGFHIPSLEFVDSDTLLVIDDSNEDATLDNAANDHTYRVFERVSTSPGAANDSVSDHLDGGFNRGTTESWNSRSIGLVNLDFAGGLATGHSEPESSAYYRDTLTGVRGMWVTESDGGGDDIAFLEIDSSGNSLGYRPHAVGAGPTFPTSFALDNDPAVNSSSNDGKADNIFVDSDTGDLIIIESGFNDFADGIGPDHEPSVIRREVLSYDNGLGQIQFGAWGSKVILDPSTETSGENPSFLERGQWAAYDSENDIVYFWNPGNGGSESPAFGLDVWALDINTGITTAFLDLDESTSLFQSDGFGDKTDFFTLATQQDDADFNGDHVVDGLDFLNWQRGLGLSGQTDNSLGDADFSGIVDAVDLGIWESQFGSTSPVAVSSAATTVPEPSAAFLLMLGVSLLSNTVIRKLR